MQWKYLLVAWSILTLIGISSGLEIQGNAKIVWKRTIPDIFYAETYGDDYNGDGLPDIVATSEDDNTVSIYAVSGKDGQILWSRSFDGYNEGWTDKADDLNGDGIKDVFVKLYNWEPYKQAIVFLSGKNGEILWSKEGKPNYHIWAYTIEDVNGDGKSELILENCSSGNSTITLYDWFNDKAIWTKTYGGWVWSIPAGDLNGDGKRDVLVHVEYVKYEDEYGYLPIPVKIKEAKALNVLNGKEFWSMLGVAIPFKDVDGDGKDDVLIFNESCCMAVRGYDASVIWSVDLSDYNCDWVEPWIVGDLRSNDNSDVDVVVKGYDKQWENGTTYADVVLIAIKGNDGEIMWTKSWDHLIYGYGICDFAFAGDLNGDGNGDLLMFVEYKVDESTEDIRTDILAISGNDGKVFWKTTRYGDMSWYYDVATLPIGDIDNDGKYDIAMIEEPVEITIAENVSVELNVTIKVPLRIRGFIEPVPPEPTTIRTFTGDNLSSTIWLAKSDKGLRFVGDSTWDIWWNRSKEPGIDFNGDGLKDVGIIEGDTIYLLTMNETAQVVIPDMTLMIWENGTYNVPVMLAHVKNVMVANVTIEFDPNIIEVVSVKANESFADSNVFYTVENDTVKFVLINTNGITTDKPKGIVDLIVKTLKVGHTPLKITYAELSDENCKPFEPLTISGSITVTVKGDFNGNGRVDIGDVVHVAYIIVGKLPQDLRADFNGNGRET